MRTSVLTSLVIVFGLVVSGAASPSAADEPQRLTAMELDQVIGGVSVGAGAGADATAWAPLVAGTRTGFSLRASATPTLATAAGYAYGVSYGGGPGATTDASSGGIAAGDFTAVRPTNVRGSGRLFSWSASATVVGAASYIKP